MMEVRQQARSFRSRASGFTLIELVISAALMSMILAGAYTCLRSGVASQKLIDSRAEIFQSGRIAMNLISADLRLARTLSREYEFLGMHRMIGEVEADNLDFATSYSSQRPNEADFCETSYFLEKDEESGEFALWRRRDPTPDDDPLSGGRREEIARGLLGLKFEYYDGFDWYDDWGDPQGKRRGQSSLLEPPNLSGLPEAVRVTLLFDSKPRSARKDSVEKPQEKETPEPPLVFQTIARINLVSASSGSSGASGSSGSSSSQGASPPRTGGPQ